MEESTLKAAIFSLHWNKFPPLFSKLHTIFEVFQLNTQLQDSRWIQLVDHLEACVIVKNS